MQKKQAFNILLGVVKPFLAQSFYRELSRLKVLTGPRSSRLYRDRRYTLRCLIRAYTRLFFSEILTPSPCFFSCNKRKNPSNLPAYQGLSFFQAPIEYLYVVAVHAISFPEKQNQRSPPQNAKNCVLRYMIVYFCLNSKMNFFFESDTNFSRTHHVRNVSRYFTKLNLNEKKSSNH